MTFSFLLISGIYLCPLIRGISNINKVWLNQGYCVALRNSRWGWGKALSECHHATQHLQMGFENPKGGTKT